MKVVLSEKQLKLILSKEMDVDEQDATAAPAAGTDPSSAQPKTGTSDTGGKQGYPEVGKWESGVTRGPANQIGVTKWSDVVGSSLKRDKANQLKEQISFIPASTLVTFDTPTKPYMSFWGEEIKLPADGSVNVSLWDDKKPRSLQFKNAFEKDGVYYWPQKYLDNNNKIYTKNELAPDEEWLKETFPTGTIRYIETKTDNRFYGVVLSLKGREWNVNNGYFYNDKSKYIPFNPKNYINRSVFTKIWDWLKEYGLTIAEILGSIIAGILTAGSSLWIQALIQVGVGMAFAGISYAIDGNEVGLAMNTFIALLPFIPAATKLGVKGPLIGLKKLGPKLAVAKTEEEVLTILKGFSKEEQLIISRCLKQLPKADFDKVVKDKLVQGFMDMARKGQITTDWVQKIPAGQLRWWKELLVEGGGALPIIAGGYAYSSAQERKKDEQELLELIKNMERNSVFNEKETDSVSWEKEIDDRILKYKQSKSKKNEKK